MRNTALVPTNSKAGLGVRKSERQANSAVRATVT